MNVKGRHWNLMVLAMIITGLLTVSCNGVTRHQRAEGGDVRKITKEELRSMLGNTDLKVLDVRLESQWRIADEKILKSGREDPEKDIILWTKKYPKDGTFVFYCD